MNDIAGILKYLQIECFKTKWVISIIATVRFESNIPNDYIIIQVFTLLW